MNYVWIDSSHIQKLEELARMSEQNKPEYISTRAAMAILKVESTQAVRYLMEQYPNELQGFNFGSDKQPRWMLRRQAVIDFQNERENKK